MEAFALTSEQQGQVCGVLAMGGDEEMAAKIIGCTPLELCRAIANDSQLAARVRRAVGSAELAHVQNIHHAAKDAKNWRVSVWWLERHAPERFAKRAPGAITEPQLAAFTELLAEALKTDVRSKEDRDRVVARLNMLAKSIEELVGVADRKDAEESGPDSEDQ